MNPTPGRQPTNVILIGMPGVGKSTVGVILAKHLGFDFIDTDLVIQRREGKRLQALILQHGLEGFKDLEARHLERIAAQKSVIATGGSVVYRDRAMAHLKALGRIVHLDLSLEPLQKRLASLDERGVVRLPGQTIAAIYAERLPLYRRHAQVTVATDDLTPDLVVNAIRQTLNILNNRISISPHRFRG